MSVVLLLVLFQLLSSAAVACVPGAVHDNPKEHRPYVGQGCVYYDGNGAGFIVEGRFKNFIISNDLLEGFRHLQEGHPLKAYKTWEIQSSFNNRGAQFNLGVMNYSGIGVSKDYVSALNYFFEVQKGLTHFNTGNAFSVRVLQQSLIEVGFLDGRADGDYGPKTDRAVDEALKFLRKHNHKGPNGEHEYWHFWKIADYADAMRMHKRAQDAPEPCHTCYQATRPQPPKFQKTETKNVPVPTGKILNASKPSIAASRASSRPRGAVEIFAMLNESVHMIYAASSLNDFKKVEDISQGSAVAINDKIMLTNCHVIEGKPYVIFKKGEDLYTASVHSGVYERDTCLISSDEISLIPVDYMRSFDDVNVGEKVYALGSPNSLENTLSEGIISGKRINDGQKVIQITAAITNGSSGGGLFDENGNLIGITTFGLGDTGALNFAIAASEFFNF